MGSPLSPILADIVLDSIIDTTVKTFSFTIPVLGKYVDDLFLAIPKDKAQIVLEQFNKQEEHLQFTAEIEQNSRLPYLDMVVVRKADQSLRTEWYSKPISSGRLLNFHSFHQLRYKINVANNYIHRVYALSTNHDRETLKGIIFQNLHANDYPKTLINNLLQQYFKKQRRSTQPAHRVLADSPPATLAPPDSDPGTTLNTTYRSIISIHGLTQRIISIFKHDYSSLRLASRQIHTVGSLHSKVKDPIHTMQQHNVVYKIPCYSCPGVYIGMTKNLLKSRLSGHKSNVNKLDNLIQDQTTTTDSRVASLGAQTALIEHCMQYQHRFAFEKTTIVDRTFRSSSLPYLEMCHITNTPHTVNSRSDVDNLSVIYAAILHTTKNYFARKKSTPP
ncbi:uncharacterized protein LOC131687310 [Topomyia yanbarensis]|uniref:uncharacterized protein LOC131687310 n=1 Tax=Topomyia yanbarensis TaxID=2498891 RepID=UPI00273C8468|nr:uncharacterized protein LOC131687310 [Topomyia yanbarensis]